MTEAVDNFRRVLSRQDGYFPPANLELSYALLSLKRYDEALPICFRFHSAMALVIRSAITIWLACMS